MRAHRQLNLLHSILAWARLPAQSYLGHDPLVGQKPPKGERTEADFLEDRDITALLAAVADSPTHDAIMRCVC